MVIIGIESHIFYRHPGQFPTTQGYNPQLITMLTVNYRTVPEILEVSSRLFYDSQLVGFVELVIILVYD